MSLWNGPKFRQPGNAIGDWRVVRRTCFEHDRPPTEVKYLIEKLTIQLLRREPMIDAAPPVLRYSGTSGAGGHLSTVSLELVAVDAGGFLYALTSERTAPKRWEDEQKFTADGERRFARGCAQLRTVSAECVARMPRDTALERAIRETVAAEEAAARITEDPAPIEAVQQEVLARLRAGMRFFTANKEGGTHLVFDGEVFRRTDYGDEPHLNETYADDAGMLASLRRFYDWDAQRDSYPRPKSELAVWNYIRGQLQPKDFRQP